MKPSLIRFLLPLLLVIALNTSHAQIEKGKLIKGKTITSEITAAENHLYTINLKKNQFAFFKLIQKDVDLIVTTYDYKGNKIADFDSPNGKNGPELFTISSTKRGIYGIVVSPINDKQLSGRYDLTLAVIKRKARSKKEQVDEIFTPWDNNETPGAAVAVVKDGSIIYKKGFGLAHLEYDIPITPASIFHIASISKQFTVFSILLLEKQGKLSLDDDVRKYIPEVPDFGKTITLRHLATHTSGLRDQWNLLSMAGWRMDDVITKEHVLKLVSKQKELNFNPGEEFVYCNTGFTLLAEVVSRISGESFAEFTQANIFTPLKMNNTLFYDDHEKIVKNRTYSYYGDGAGFKKSVLNYANVGATSLFTTVEDLSLWAMNFSTLTVGDKNIINTMNTPAVLNNGETFGGALGQFVGEYKGLKEIEHGGADAGYRTFLSRYPDENFAVIVFSNSADFNSARMAHQIVDIYLEDKIKVKPTKAKDTAEHINVDQNILSAYEGEFEIRPGLIINISLDDGQLFAQASALSSRQLLQPLSTTEFDVEGLDRKVEFIADDAGNIKSLKVHQGEQITEAKRLDKFDKSAVNLSDFTGDFYSRELSTTYRFIVVDDTLVAKHSRLSDFNLIPIKKDVFSGKAWFFGQVEFVRDSNGVVTACKVSNGRVRNLHFDKVKIKSDPSAL
ncbi:MAG: DUF3471 domain-containing protein [Proteobacteria bacterium]|nr:MAG: DUF3471 domain-containing protein [Pseudomonadota bacterium]